MNPFLMPVEQVEDLVDRHGTPSHIVSRSQIIENYRRLDRLLPVVDIYYAVKANPQPETLRLLCEAGADFDVASGGEILAADAAGANATRRAPLCSLVCGFRMTEASRP